MGPMVDEPKAKPLDPDATTRLIDFARACKAAARAVSLYPAGHPTVGTTVGRLVEAAGRASAVGGFTLMVLPDNLLVNGSPAARSDPAVGELAALLHRHFVGGLALNGAADAESWQTLMRLLGRPPEEVRAEGGIKQLWTQMGAQSIEIEEIDYAQILREGAEAASLEEIMSRLLTGEGEWDASTIEALVDIVGDPAMTWRGPGAWRASGWSSTARRNDHRCLLLPTDHHQLGRQSSDSSRKRPRPLAGCCVRPAHRGASRVVLLVGTHLDLSFPGLGVCRFSLDGLDAKSVGNQ